MSKSHNSSPVKHDHDHGDDDGHSHSGYRFYSHDHDHHHDRSHVHSDVHSHDDGYSHSHDNGQDGRGHAGHDHASGASRNRLMVALSLSVWIMVAQMIGASITGSLALLADAGHMAVDSSGLVIALIAAHLLVRPRTQRMTWGYSRAEAIAAALQSGMLLVICIGIAYESIGRLFEPPNIAPVPMLVFGMIGLIANAISMFVLLGGRHESLNLRAAFLEVATDAAGSAAVIIAALCAWFTGWVQADIVASIIIVVLMVPRALVLLRLSVGVLVERTPPELDVSVIEAEFEKVPGVVDVHDLHISTIRSGLVALSAHVAVPVESTAEQRNDILHQLEELSASAFAMPINHTTFQLDSTAHREHENVAH